MVVTYELKPANMSLLKNFELELDLYNHEKEDETYECEHIDILRNHHVSDERCGIYEVTIPLKAIPQGVLLNVNGRLRNKENYATIPSNTSHMHFGTVRIPVSRTTEKSKNPPEPKPSGSSPKKQQLVDSPTVVVFQVEFENAKKDVSINRSTLTITHLEEEVRKAFQIDESTELKFQSKARENNFVIEKKFEVDQCVASFDSRSQFISVKLGKKKEKEDKIKVFLLTPDKRVKYMMKKKTSLKEFRDEIKSKIKSTGDNFTVEIATGKFPNKKILTDNDVATSLCDGDEVKITLG